MQYLQNVFPTHLGMIPMSCRFDTTAIGDLFISGSHGQHTRDTESKMKAWSTIFQIHKKFFHWRLGDRYHSASTAKSRPTGSLPKSYSRTRARLVYRRLGNERDQLQVKLEMKIKVKVEMKVEMKMRFRYSHNQPLLLQLIRYSQSLLLSSSDTVSHFFFSLSDTVSHFFISAGTVTASHYFISAGTANRSFRSGRPTASQTRSE